MENNKRIFKKADVVLIVCLLAASLAVFGAFRLFSGAGLTVKVTADNKAYASLPLDKDAELNIKSAEGYNLLVIKDKKAYIAQSDCKNQICVNSAPISKEGELIVCLPHKVVVSIESGKT